MPGLYETQKLLEEESAGLGIAKYREAMEKGEADLPPGMKLLKQAIVPLSKAITAFLADALSGRPGNDVGMAKFLSQFDPDISAFVVAKRVINGMSTRETLQNVAMSISSQLEDALNHDKLKAEAPKLYKRLLEKIRHVQDQRRRHVVMRKQQAYAKVDTIIWGVSEKLRLGTLLVRLMAAHSGLVDLELVNEGKNKSIYYIQATPTWAEWLKESHSRCELLSPVYMPMVYPPRPWTTPTDGGYLTRHTRIKLVSARNKKNFLEELKSWEMPDVYRAVNALQATAWKINAEVYAVMQEMWDGGGSLGGLPPRDDLPLPAQSYGTAEENPEAHKAWKAAAAQVYTDNIRLVSKRAGMFHKLWVAEKFVEFGAIYFPHRLDWRGRVYPVSSFVNPQGDDSGKALLHFSEGVPLGDTGAEWLMVHGANSYGVDKVSFEERREWVRQHEALILDSAENPLDGQRFWADADSPYQFLAFCFEWAGFLQSGCDQSYKSHLPVSFDGSCNGLQNFSMMLRDPVGGAATNLVPHATPADIYTEVAKVAQARVDLDAAGSAECAPLAQYLAGKIGRKLAKRPTMTMPYGAGKFGFKDQLIAEFAKMPMGTFQGNQWDVAQYLAGVMYGAIGDVVIAARQAMDWLQQAARVVAKEGLPIHWETPSGMLVHQDYREQFGKVINSYISGHRVQLTLQIMGDKIDRRKMANGIAPNFVHSMDASHMVKTVGSCLDAGITAFAMVHDSYGVHAAHAEALSYHLRRAFVEMYSGDVLGNFRDQLLAQLPPELAKDLPPCPPMGTLDLSAVMDSKYFFA